MSFEENFFYSTYLEENNSSKIFDGLNAEQKKAVDCLAGPLLIMAGAGSGKTRVLTCRIANLLAHGVAPWKILAITFTNKAANEMKSRAEKMIGSKAQSVWLSTFHSFCAKVLRQEIEVTNIYKKNYVIYDSSDSQVVVKEGMKALKLDEERFTSVAARISDAKNNLLDAKHYKEELFKKHRISDFEKHVAVIYELYEKKLIENNALDFDDLIFVMVRILVEYPEVREKYQEKFQYILVDEYQDTNMAQYQLTKFLAAKHKNICVVGDADQSIYGWRGADMRNILNFEQDYPGATVIKLEQNYRSTKQILAAANAVIKNNEIRKDKKLWTNNAEGEPIIFADLGDDGDEAMAVTREIRRLVEQENFRYSDIALLYRTNAQSRALEEKFMYSEIPYMIVGGLKFYERKEVKDILAYLRLIFNPRDNVSLQRIVNVPKRGLGTTNLAKLEDFAEEKNLSMFEVIVDNSLLMQVPSLNPKFRQTIRSFAAMILSFAESSKNLAVDELINAVLNESGYLHSLREGAEGQKPENISRVENLGAFVNSAKEFHDINSSATLEDFLNHVALITDLDAMDEEESRVSLMTVHSAKGLEFPVVFITGMEEGIFPHANSMMNQEQLEEERRACYVAITRAQKKLYITAAHRRMSFGKYKDSEISQFVKEIPPHLMIMAGITKKTSSPKPSSKPKKSSSYSSPTAYKDAASSPMKRAVSKIKPDPNADFNVGDQIKHGKWGVGMILEIKGSGDDKMATISFADPAVGVKDLKLKIAPIKKV